MSGGKFPRAYTSDVRKDDGMMEYINTEKMGIGARPSGMPKGDIAQIKSLEHVGKGTPGSAKAVK